MIAPIADLRATTGDAAELVDQLHHGEQVRVLASRDEWRYVQGEDHYFGWTRARHLAAIGETRGRLVVARPLAPVRAHAAASSEVIALLPAGTALPPPAASADGWLPVTVSLESGVTRGAIRLEDAIDLADVPHRSPTADDLIATAEAFVGVPYLWGGTTGLGLDCSGYVQQVYRLNGLRLDRDADQQAMEGRPVDVPARGDLVFFGKAAITHVGIARDERTMLNALGGKKVQVDDIDGLRVGVLAVRRYLP
ncbi:MAG: C40 family peptidase [Chloroflexota bacterium]|nr:C40 family peptidase [Chloroflexota bacterium]